MLQLNANDQSMDQLIRKGLWANCMISKGDCQACQRFVMKQRSRNSQNMTFFVFNLFISISCIIIKLFIQTSNQMQFLLNQGKFNFGVYPKSEAFNPFHQFADDIEKKRSRLFPDRKRIPGRKTKFIFAIAFLIQGFAMVKLIQAKKIYGLKAAEQQKLQRKAAPYFQSITDMEYVITKHRTDLILAEIFKSKGGVAYIEKNPAYHNPKIFVPARGKDGYGVWAGAGTGRYSEGLLDKMHGNFCSGFNSQNA